MAWPPQAAIPIPRWGRLGRGVEAFPIAHPAPGALRVLIALGRLGLPPVVPSDPATPGFCHRTSFLVRGCSSRAEAQGPKFPKRVPHHSDTRCSRVGEAAADPGELLDITDRGDLRAVLGLLDVRASATP